MSTLLKTVLIKRKSDSFNMRFLAILTTKKMKVRFSFAVDLAQNPNSASELLEEIEEMNKYSYFMGKKLRTH